MKKRLQHWKQKERFCGSSMQDAMKRLAYLHNILGRECRFLLFVKKKERFFAIIKCFSDR